MSSFADTLLLENEKPLSLPCLPMSKDDDNNMQLDNYWLEYLENIFEEEEKDDERLHHDTGASARTN